MLENLIIKILENNPLNRIIGRRRSLTSTMRDNLLEQYDRMAYQQTIRYNGHNNPYESSFYNHVKALHDKYWDMSYYHHLIKQYEVDKKNGKI